MHNVLSDLLGTEKRLLVRLVVLALVAVCPAAFAAQTNDTTAAQAAYTRTLNQRADKIVATLDIGDANQAVRVHGLIVQQYRDLSKIHEARDAEIKAAKARALQVEPENKAGADGPIAQARAVAKPKLDELHGEFLTRLAAELSPEQVEKVKDGLTYGVVPLTYGVYLKMYPELTDAQKQQIRAWLVEARELAMDGSTSDEKHAVFGKYKGRINNYLSKAGYDAKKGEQNLKKATQSASETKPK